METLTPEQWKEFIEKEIQSTLKKIDMYRDLAKPLAPENAIGRVSRMDAINNQSTMNAALKQAELKLEKLEFVLQKIGDTDFGKCLKCHNPIPPARILIMPQSQLCVNCAR